MTIPLGGSIVLFLLSACGARTPETSQEPPAQNDLINTAQAVVAVEVLSTDYEATPLDGPMVAVARVLKVVKGPLTEGQSFQFTETAWVSPT